MACMLLFEMLSLVFTLLSIFFLLLATISDVRSRLIPDGLIILTSLSALLAFLARLVAQPDPIAWYSRMLPALLGMLLLSYFFWRLGVWADGDALLAPFLALLLPQPSTVIIFIILTLLTGGLLALGFLGMLAKRAGIHATPFEFLLSLFAALPLLLFKPFTLALGMFLFVWGLLVSLLIGRRVEQAMLVQTIPLAKAIPGDWLVAVRTRHGWEDWGEKTGVSQADLERLARLGVREVRVKQGMPFLPALFLGLLATLLLYAFKPGVLSILAWLSV